MANVQTCNRRRFGYIYLPYEQKNFNKRGACRYVVIVPAPHFW